MGPDLLGCVYREWNTLINHRKAFNNNILLTVELFYFRPAHHATFIMERKVIVVIPSALATSHPLILGTIQNIHHVGHVSKFTLILLHKYYGCKKLSFGFDMTDNYNYRIGFVWYVWNFGLGIWKFKKEARL